MIAEELSVLLGQPLNPYREENPVRCPLHDDRVASMSINLRKGTWNCFGCGKGGGLQTLARFLGGDLDRTDLIVHSVSTEPEPEPVDFSDKYYGFEPITVFTPEAQVYRKEKGISHETLEHFKVRHDKGTLVMPYFDGDRVVALRYRGRDNRKWYEIGSERTIYNINEVRGANRVILCEGESDTHSMWNLWSRFNLNGYVVAGIPGANSSRERWELWSLDLMWAERIWIAFDNDDAGDKGFDRAKEILGDKAFRLSPPEGYNDWSDALKAGQTPELV